MEIFVRGIVMGTIMVIGFVLLTLEAMYVTGLCLLWREEGSTVLRRPWLSVKAFDRAHTHLVATGGHRVPLLLYMLLLAGALRWVATPTYKMWLLVAVALSPYLAGIVLCILPFAAEGEGRGSDHRLLGP